MTSEGGGAGGISALSDQAGVNPSNAMRTGGLDESAVSGGGIPGYDAHRRFG